MLLLCYSNNPKIRVMALQPNILFRGMLWQARRDSNPQHPDLESGALPLELLAYDQTDIKYVSVIQPLDPGLPTCLLYGAYVFCKNDSTC